jgi:hypothetical protein
MKDTNFLTVELKFRSFVNRILHPSASPKCWATHH